MKMIPQTCLSVLTAIVCTAGLHAASVPEPSTIIYGKVLHRAHGHEHRLTEGTLVWTLRDQNGVSYTFSTELENIGDTFSYRLPIPHQALASGLSVDSAVIPLRPNEIQYDFVSITINGSPVEVISSGSDFVKLLQRSRAATHRIDLRAGFDLEDTDGDGIPDWWEKLHGLDWQTPDAHLDSSGDGWTNLQAYLNGADPNRDNRVPTLLTAELATYASSENGVWLRAIDADTPPSGLTFTLVSAPVGGTMLFDHGTGGTVEIEAGFTFTQQDLSEGRVLFVHEDTDVADAVLTVSLTDGVHDPQEFEVGVHVFFPGTELPGHSGSPEWWRDENAVFQAYWGMRENVLSGEFIESSLLYFLGSKYGWTIWDQRSETLPVTIKAAGAGSHFILGGDAPDVLTGSDQDDILSGGRGVNRLRGGGGRDLFIVSHPGLEIIEDFSMAQDVLDLGALLHGKTGSLNSYLSAQPVTGGSEIRMNFAGAGVNFTDAAIRLEGVTLVQDDLHRLWSTGQLLLGSVTGFSSVSIEGWPTAALEEGFSTAAVTFRRNGPVSQPLTVFLSISGSATNGVDYTLLPSSISFAAGSSTTSLVVEPLLDGIAEGTEILQLGLASGQGYVFGSPHSGQIQIIDAKQRFNIQAVDEYAIADEDPGYLRISRQGPRNGVVELLLSFSGTAVRDVDYLRINSLVTFSDQQASRLIPVHALSLGDLAGSEKSKLLTVAIRPPFDDEYLLGKHTSASIRLLSEEQSFEEWASHTLAGATDDGTTSPSYSTLSSRTGLDALLEYALSYGLNLSDGVSPQEQEQLRPRLARDSGGWHFEFSKRLNDASLEYTIERSADLVTWHSDPSLFAPMALPASERDRGRVRYRVVELQDTDMPFMRVRVNRKP